MPLGVMVSAWREKQHVQYPLASHGPQQNYFIFVTIIIAEISCDIKEHLMKQNFVVPIMISLTCRKEALLGIPLPNILKTAVEATFAIFILLVCLTYE